MLVVMLAKEMLHDRLGRLTKGATVEIPDKMAHEWLQRGWCERYETKVIRDVPMPAGGRMELSSAAPPVPVSAQTTSSGSDSGVKKRGRPKKEAS